MKLKRFSIAVPCGVTVVLVSVLALMASPGAAGRLGAVGTAGARLIGGPVVTAEAGTASAVLPSAVIQVGPKVTLVNSVLLTDTFTITCGAFLVDGSESASFDLVEAQGRVLAHASRFVQGVLHCDGSPHTFTVDLVSSDHPFRPSSNAVMSAFAFTCGITPNGQNICQSGRTVSTVKIRK